MTSTIEITVYTKPACVQCNATYRKLDNLVLNYQSIDVSKHEKDLEFIKNLGYLQAPVVVIKVNGTMVDHWSGFQPDKIGALAEQVQQAQAA